MKHLSLTWLLTALFLLLPTSIFAEEFIVDGIKYSTLSSSTVEVTANNYSGEIVIPAQIKYNSKTYSVTCIRYLAFKGCWGLTSVTIPEGVTTIGYMAFRDCSGLISITIPEGVTSIEYNAFQNCSGLTSVVIPESVTSIGGSAFAGCSGLTSVTIPEGVTSIEGGTFSDCRALTSITIPGSVTSIGGNAFWNCRNLSSITIPNSVTSIGGSAFSGTAWFDNQPDGLVYADKVAYKYKGEMPANTSISLSEGTKCIAVDAFHDCIGLTSVTIPQTLTNIGNGAFQGCSSLTSVTIPKSVTSIGNDAFSSCSGLISVDLNCANVGDWFRGINSIEEVILGENVTSIGDYAFQGCTGLTSVSIPSSVTSIGNDAFSGCSGLKVNLNCANVSTWFAGNESLKEVILGENVASIGEYAFWCCRNLTSVTISNSVTSIGNDAFYGCGSLTSVTIPNSVTSIGDDAFSGCSDLTSVNLNCAHVDNWFSGYSSLEEVILGENVTSIGSSAFADCSGLTSVTIPNSVTEIGNEAFKGCCGLTSLTIGNSVESIGSSAFSGCSGLTSVTIPNSVTEIGNEAFKGCSSMTLLTIGNSVESIGSSAFRDCSSLTSVTIHGSVTSIGNSAFRDCSSLTSMTIPGSVTNIGNSAFSGCKGLTSVIIPNSVTSIGNSAFSGCNGLTSVTIPNSVTSISGSAFNGCNGLKSVNLNCANVGNWFSGISSIEEVVLGEDVISIGGTAFSACTGLTSVTIPSGLTSIGAEAFLNCSGLTSVTIPNSVTSIGESTFNGCRNLTSITIPDNLTSIGGSAFSGCSGLTSVTIKGNLTSIGWDAFSGCTGLRSVNLNCANVDGWFSDISSIEEVVFGEDVTSINNSAFSGCSGLTSITIPRNVTSIESEAFSYCSNLTSISVDEANAIYDSRDHCNAIIKTASNELIAGCSETIIPNSVKKISTSAFKGCANLSSIDIPTSVTSIQSNAFEDCTGLTSFIVPSSISSFGSDVFIGCENLQTVGIYCRIVPGWFKDKPSVTSLTLGNNVTSIGNNTFQGCTGLTTVNIPNSVKSIGDYAFWNCSGLENIRIGNAVTSIGVHAFNSCTSLSSVTLPSTMSSIGRSAFYGCSSLNTVSVGMKSPVSIDESVFNNRSSITLNVPVGSKGSYQNAPYWQEFLKIQENGIGDEVTEIDVTDIAQLDNVIYIEEMEARTATEATISLKMKNSAAIRGFQFDLYLPQGVTVVKSSRGKIQGSLSAGRLPEDDEHTLTFSEQPDGAIRFLCSSQYDETFTGNDGEIATLQVAIADNMEDGNYAIQMKNMKLTETNISKYYETALVQSKMTIFSYIIGDISGDNVVDVSDYTGVANYIHGNTPAGFNAKAADVDANGTIDVSDYTGIANIIHTGSIYGNISGGAVKSLIPWKVNTDVSSMENIIYISPFTASAGSQIELSLKMKNTADIRGFQFDLYLPEGMTVVKSERGKIQGSLSAGRLPDEDEHELTFSEQPNGAIRFLCSSQYDETFTGNDGEIATLKVNISANMTNGDYPILLKDMKLTETDISRFYMTDMIETTVTIGESDSRILLAETSVTVPETKTNVDVRVNRTIKANEWSTICLPFAISATQMQTAFGNDVEVELADFTGYETVEEGSNVVGINVNFATATAIAANHPYIIKVSKPVTEILVDGVDINPEDEPTVATVNRTRRQWSELIGTYVANTTVPEKTLFLSDNKFYYSTGATKMKAFRAYFDFYDVLTNVDESYPVKMMIDINGEETGIENMVNGQGTKENVYDLSGRKVTKPQHRGVYIVNGKKTLIK